MFLHVNNTFRETTEKMKPISTIGRKSRTCTEEKVALGTPKGFLKLNHVHERESKYEPPYYHIASQANNHSISILLLLLYKFSSFR